MEDYSKGIYEKVRNLIVHPLDFQNIKDITENIEAYGELEYLDGYLSGIISEYKELKEELVQYNTISEILEVHNNMMAILKQTLPDNKVKRIQTLYTVATLTILHSKYKKINAYGLKDYKDKSEIIEEYNKNI